MEIEFDSAQIPPQTDYEPLMVGEYVAAVVDSTVAPNSKNTGTLIKLKLQVLQGEAQGRITFANINFKHENELAQRIGQAQFSQLCRAVGLVGPVTDTCQLHDVPIRIRIGSRSDGKGVEVKSFAPFAQEAPQAAHQAAATNAPSGGKKEFPWKK